MELMASTTSANLQVSPTPEDHDSKRGEGVAAGLFALVAEEALSNGPTSRIDLIENRSGNGSAPTGQSNGASDETASAADKQGGRASVADETRLPWWLRGQSATDLEQVSRLGDSSTSDAGQRDVTIQPGTGGKAVPELESPSLAKQLETGKALRGGSDPAAAQRAGTETGSERRLLVEKFYPTVHQRSGDERLTVRSRGAGDEKAGGTEVRAMPRVPSSAARNGRSVGGSRMPREKGSREGPAPRPSHLSSTGFHGGRPAPGTGSVDMAAPVGDAAAAAAEAARDGVEALYGSLRATVRVQAVRALQIALIEGNREAVVTLSPPTLGRIRIRVRIVDQQISARLSAEQPDVEKILQADRNVIRQRLAERGLRLETLVIDRGGAASAAETSRTGSQPQTALHSSLDSGGGTSGEQTADWFRSEVGAGQRPEVPAPQPADAVDTSAGSTRGIRLTPGQRHLARVDLRV